MTQSVRSTCAAASPTHLHLRPRLERADVVRDAEAADVGRRRLLHLQTADRALADVDHERARRRRREALDERDQVGVNGTSAEQRRGSAGENGRSSRYPPHWVVLVLTPSN